MSSICKGKLYFQDNMAEGQDVKLTHHRLDYYNQVRSLSHNICQSYIPDKPIEELHMRDHWSYQSVLFRSTQERGKAIHGQNNGQG